MSYMIARRRKEICVRMALGADRRRVVQLVLKEAILLLGVGLAMGVALSLWVVQVAESFYSASVSRLCVAWRRRYTFERNRNAAGYIPARRAAADDPMSALRVE